MSEYLDDINENLTELYNEIPKDTMDDIKDIWKSIQEYQKKIDNYLNQCKNNNLDYQESSRIVINCYKDLKTSSLDLYKQVENFEDDLPDMTEFILEFVSDYLEDINEQIKYWKDKLGN